MKNEVILSEKQLFIEISEGSEQAFRLIFERYYRRMLSFVGNMVKASYVAEEIVQEAFIRLWENRDLLAEIKHPNDYLFILVRNHTLNYLRKIANDQKRLDELWLAIEQKNMYVDVPLEAEETAHVLQNILQRLSPQRQKIFHLSRYMGLSHQEIATQLHISKNTVKNHLTASLHALKIQLKQSGILLLIILAKLF